MEEGYSLYSDMHSQLFPIQIETNNVAKSDPVIQNFFSEVENLELLLEANNGVKESQKELDKRFQIHFFQIRFVAFIVNNIKFCAIDQFRTQQKRNTRFPLIFDQPLSYEKDSKA